MKRSRYFSPELFRFLKELRENNNREWFRAHKAGYESVVRGPFLRFIADLAPHLRRISWLLVADPRPTGGSLFRIHRDIRFAKDKSPYKTHVAAHFWHGGAGEEGHAPVFYLHFEPGMCFAGAGLWHPDAATLRKVREAIVGRPEAWQRVRRKLPIEGEVLNRPPKGYDPEHPFIEDLKHKDFVSSVPFTEPQVCSVHFLRDYVAACRKMTPLMEFLAKALGLPW